MEYDVTNFNNVEYDVTIIEIQLTKENFKVDLDYITSSIKTLLRSNEN